MEEKKSSLTQLSVNSNRNPFWCDQTEVVFSLHAIPSFFLYSSKCFIPESCVVPNMGGHQAEGAEQ